MSAASTRDCEICGEPAASQVVVVPAEFARKNGAKVVKRSEVRAWLCATHHARVLEGFGWQKRERERLKRLEVRDKERAEAAHLFDPGPRVGRRRGRA